MMNSREAFGRHASRNVCQHQTFERTCCTSATKTDFSASSLQGNIQQFQVGTLVASGFLMFSMHCEMGMSECPTHKLLV